MSYIVWFLLGTAAGCRAVSSSSGRRTAENSPGLRCQPRFSPVRRVLDFGSPDFRAVNLATGAIVDVVVALETRRALSRGIDFRPCERIARPCSRVSCRETGGLPHRGTRYRARACVREPKRRERTRARNPRGSPRRRRGAASPREGRRSASGRACPSPAGAARPLPCSA